LDAISQEAQRFIARIHNRDAVLGIIGLGYVGIPLALAALRQGLRVVGFDIDAKRVEQINAGTSTIKHIPMELIVESTRAGRFIATTDFDRMAEPDALLIAVPTPLSRHREPDLSFVRQTTTDRA
jgi:UDP-N-acetyl-D-glucosamine dehydrogenase